jgi:hypothetical protein
MLAACVSEAFAADLARTRKASAAALRFLPIEHRMGLS